MLDSRALTLPPAEQITRVTLTKMRQRLLKQRAFMQNEKKELNRQVGRGAYLRAGTVRPNWYYSTKRDGNYIVPPRSTTKGKRQPDRVIYARMKELDETITKINALLIDIDERISNLPNERPVNKRKPIVPPSADEF